MTAGDTSLPAVRVQQHVQVVMDDEKLKLIGSTIAPDLNPAELRLFGEVAMRSGLDPFAKQIYAVKRQGKVQFQTSIDGYRSIAARTGEYDGQDEPVFEEPCPCGQEPKGHPARVTVRVYRHGMTRGVAASAYWHEYKPTDNDFMWKKMPHVMLAKVAEALALRKAFPYIMGELYTEDEMEQADAQPGRATAPLAAATTPGQAEAQSSAGAATTPADDDSGPSYEGSVIAPLPDRVREQKRPEWFTQVPPTTMLAKCELKFTVGRGKHTAILLGDYAFAIRDAALTEGDTVRVFGERVEVNWKEGMPTKKEIRYVTRVDVLRDGDWQRLTPSPDAPVEDPAEPGVIEGDFVEAAEAVFAGDIEKSAPESLEDHDEAAQQGGEQPPDPGSLPYASGEGDFDLELAVVDFAWKESKSKRNFVLAHFTDNKSLFSGIMAEDEALIQLAEGEAGVVGGSLWKFQPGDRVRVVGGWHMAGNDPVVLLTAVVAP